MLPSLSATTIRRGDIHLPRQDDAVATVVDMGKVRKGVTGKPVSSHRLRVVHLLNSSVNLITRELNRVQGHTRQFILYNEALILICTCGLWEGTFPNMIAYCTVPFLLTIHKALNKELKMEGRIRALFGRAYCGVLPGS